MPTCPRCDTQLFATGVVHTGGWRFEHEPSVAGAEVMWCKNGHDYVAVDGDLVYVGSPGEEADDS
jgi:hypothetical protein